MQNPRASNVRTDEKKFRKIDDEQPRSHRANELSFLHVASSSIGRGKMLDRHALESTWPPGYKNRGWNVTHLSPVSAQL